MFVRGAGRILRHGGDGHSAALHPFLSGPRKKKKTTTFQCYVPFVWQALVAVLVGLLLLALGSGLCTVGYYAEHLATSLRSNGTHLVDHVDSTKQRHIHSLTFLGPVLMGLGCFAIVVSCVVVCEKRDVRLKEIEEARKALAAKQGKKKKPKIYDAILHQLRARKDSSVMKADGDELSKQLEEKQLGSSSGRSQKAHKSLIKELLEKCSPSSSQDPDYKNVSVALRRMTMDIFSVDMEGLGPTSLHPVYIPSPRVTRKPAPLIKKFPSAPCLKETTKTPEPQPEHQAQPPRPPDAARQDQCVVDMTEIKTEPDKPGTSTPEQSRDCACGGESREAPATVEQDAESSVEDDVKVIVHRASVHQEEGQVKEDTGGTREEPDLGASISGVTPEISQSLTRESSTESFDLLHLDDDMLKIFEQPDEQVEQDGLLTKVEDSVDDTGARCDDVGDTNDGGSVGKDKISPVATPIVLCEPKTSNQHIPVTKPKTAEKPHRARTASHTKRKTKSRAQSFEESGGSMMSKNTPKGFRLRTDPNTSELTVRVTCVPYSKHMASDQDMTSLRSRKLMCGISRPMSRSANHTPAPHTTSFNN